MKKFIKNILYFVAINAILFICHIWALFGVAFNDTGVQYNNIGEAMRIILFGIVPLIIGSIILMNVFKKKKDFLIYQFLILQVIVIIGWGMFYIINYVPNSAINKYMQTIENEKIINSQNQKNEEAIKELKNGYILFDSIENYKQKVKLYLNENNKKVIIELKINDSVNYCIIDTIKNHDTAEMKIYKYNSNYNVQIDNQNQLSIVLNSGQYGIYKEKMLNGWNKPIKYMVDIYVGTERYDPINIYREMIEESISKGEKIYYIKNKL